MKISIVGAGAWGTSVALSSLRAGHTITLITKSQQDADEINTNHENITFFPGIKIPDSIYVTHRYDSLKTCDVLFLVCPSVAIDDVCKNIQSCELPTSTPIISFCKGLPGNSWELPSMYIERNFPQNHFGIISGPSYAKEVALGFPTRLILASADNCCKKATITFDNIAVDYSTDVIGVELGGCLKNIYAIGAGIIDGLQLGENAKCSYITASLGEMIQVGSHLDAQEATFLGPSGLGDLCATCSGSWSRNRTFGESLTKNCDAQKIFNISVSAIEGYRSTKTFHNIFKEKCISAPIINALYTILYSGENISCKNIKTILLSSVF